jgi:hypothetical protein
MELLRGIGIFHRSRQGKGFIQHMFLPHCYPQRSNYSFCHSPRENLFNSIPDSGARMLALCTLHLDEEMIDRGNLQTILEA